MFDDYIEYWLGVKVTAEKDGDFALRAIAKLMLNSLYGKFAKRPKTRSKYPIFETGKVQYRLGDMEDVGNLYIPVGTFITSYARDYTIRSAQKNYDRFLYADTDSLHLEGEEYPSEINIDKYELGAWKHEGTFARAKYLRAKCYLEDMEYELDKIIEKLDDDPDMINRTDLIAKTISEITCSGMPAKLHNFVTYEKFHIGMKLEGKLRFVHVPGGIVLEETTFEIKP